MDIAEEKLCKLKYRAIELSKMKHKGESNNIRASVSCETTSGSLIYVYLESLKKKRLREVKDRKTIGRNNGYNFSKFGELLT